MAADTSRIGLGTGIVNVYSRTANQLAMAAATLEDLSSGRFVLGIGASSRGVVSSWHQLRFEGQLERVRSTIDVLRRTLAPGVEGSHPPFSALLKPVEIVVAGVLDRMVLLAKEKADGVLFFMRKASEVERDASKLASSTFKVYANVVACVSGDPSLAELRARRTVAYYLTYGDSYRRLAMREEGRTAETVAKVRETWLAGRVEEATKSVPEELLRELAIFGRPADCRRQIEDLYEPIKKLAMLGLQYNPGERDAAESIRLYCSVAQGDAERSNTK